MFAQRRAYPLGRAGGVRQLGHDPRHAEWLAVRQLGLQEHFACQVLRVIEHVLGRIDAAGRYFGGVQHLYQLLQRQAVGPAVDYPVQLVTAQVAAIVGGQGRVVGQVGAANGLHEALEDRIAVGADLYMLAVGAGVNGGGRDAWHDVAGTFADKAEHIELRDHAFHHGEDRFVQGHVYHLALAAVDFPVSQRHQCTDHTPQGSNRVTDGNTRAHRWAVVEAGDVAQAAHRLAHGAEARLVLHRPGLAEARQAHHYQARVERVQHVPAQAEFFQHARAEVLDQDVGVGQQAF